MTVCILSESRNTVQVLYSIWVGITHMTVCTLSESTVPTITMQYYLYVLLIRQCIHYTKIRLQFKHTGIGIAQKDYMTID